MLEVLVGKQVALGVSGVGEIKYQIESGDIRSCIVIFFFFQAEDGIRDRDVTGVQTCALPIFGAAFHGTLSISGITVTAVIVDLARSLSQQGFRLLAIANAHLDPEHLTALNEAVKLARADRLLPVVFPDLTQKPWALRLGDEFKSGACHAGQFESSIVLSERPAAVREAVRGTLPPNPPSLSDAIRAGKRTFEEAGGPRAYFGDPAAATAGEGSRLVDALGAILEEAVLAEI